MTNPESPDPVVPSTHRPTRVPPVYLVRAGSRPVACRGCPADVYWGKTDKGKAAPMDCGSTELARNLSKSYNLNLRPPTPTSDGAGINHFASCPRAKEFKK